MSAVSFEASATTPTILVYGDSISAAYGLRENEGWVNLLAQKLNKSYPHYQVINASVSGETTGGGVTRLPKTLEVHQPEITIIELGGNDGLRGYPIEKIQGNLDTMIQLALGRQSKIVLIGMALPPNYGRRYTIAFENTFATLAERHAVTFVPRLLDGPSTERELIQRDGIHPTAAAQPQLLADIWQHLCPLLTVSTDMADTPCPDCVTAGSGDLTSDSP